MKFIRFFFPVLVVIGVAMSVGLYALGLNATIGMALSHKGTIIGTIAGLYADSTFGWVVAHQALNTLIFYLFLLFLGSCRTTLTPKSRVPLLGIVFVISVALIMLIFPR